MIAYLLDENVIREMKPGGHAHVRRWLAGVDDNQLRISVITFFEKRLGWEREKRKLQAAGKDLAEIEKRLAEIAAFEASFGDRLIPMDAPVMAEWARLLGAKEKNQRDTALAATARVHGLVIVTRNTKDFNGRGVKVLNPFKSPTKVEEV